MKRSKLSVLRLTAFIGGAVTILTACGGGQTEAAAVEAAAAVAVRPAPPAAPTPVQPPAPPASSPVPGPIVPPTPGAATPPTAAAPTPTIDLRNLPNYSVPTLPAHYDASVLATDNTPANSTVTNARAALGRVLFYDRQLSVNNTIACASCHRQEQAFGDPRRFSVGFAGGLTTAHSMRLINARFFGPGTMFWDKRAASLEAQALQPITHPVEMGFDAANGGVPAMLARLNSLPYYPELFTAAFGDSTATANRVSQALAQFQRAMVSTNSRWDTGYAINYNPSLPDAGLNAPIASFTPQEERGRQLFMANRVQGGLACATCHVPPSFALAGNARSNGLDAGQTTVFKSPSLKGVSRSGAFMHDGRFNTLQQVVEHYNSGVQDGPSLDDRLRGPNGVRRLNLSEADKAALVAFLTTLDDTALINDAKFSNPFTR